MARSPVNGYVVYPSSRGFMLLRTAKAAAKAESKREGDARVENADTGKTVASYADGRPTRTNGGRKKMRSGAKKLAAWVRSQVKSNPRVRTRVVRKNSTTINGYKSVTVKKLPDGRVQVTGRK